LRGLSEPDDLLRAFGDLLREELDDLLRDDRDDLDRLLPRGLSEPDDEEPLDRLRLSAIPTSNHSAGARSPRRLIGIAATGWRGN